MKKRIGLSLGGGGVRGLAHVPILETLDDLGVRPSVISGTSMGALIGALYASGLSGRQIRDLIERHAVLKSDTWSSVFKKKASLLKWVDAFSLEFGRGGIINTDNFLNYLLSEVGENTFEKLKIPLIVIAVEFWEGREVVLQRGDLLPAIKASMAVPGVFRPVTIDDDVLIDGGVVNLVPYDHIIPHCDISIAVNVAKTRIPGKHDFPSVLESILGTFEIMQMAALAQKMKRQKPDIYIRPEINDVTMLDFTKIENVYQQTEPAVIELRKTLKNLISRRHQAG